tara:strand:- start:361 stop:1014 length:654 start_codon:yes stop_codon:yes gene_type:complete
MELPDIIETTFSENELKLSGVPDDLHHLWSILTKNKEKIVKMNSILTDLKMIPGIYPSEVKGITSSAYTIISGTSKKYSNYWSKRMQYSNDFLAYCYLKYGLDGIVVAKKKTCTICNEGFKYHNEEEYCEKMKNIHDLCCNNNHSHELKFQQIGNINSMFLICVKCGVYKKFSQHTLDEPGSIGMCLSTINNNHNFTIERFLECPYEEWIDDDNNIV